MRLSSVVFPAPRKPVKTVIGTVLPSSAMMSISAVSLSDRRPMLAERRSSSPLLLDEFAQIDIHRLRQRDEIDLRRVRKLGELFAIDVGRIVLMRIYFEIARPLFLLRLARQP